MTDLLIDAFEFCRLNESREGEAGIADFPRLAEESVDKAGKVGWSVQGGSTRLRHPRLVLSVTGQVSLMCQRCLTPFVFDLASSSTLVLAAEESGIEEIEEQLADDDVDVIVGSRHFDLRQLIEDEALLALPLAPKHEVCPDPSLLAGAKDDEKVSPFAVLKDLKKPR